MEQNNIMVSVICITYNHEKYIRQCLEGCVSQKTDFSFEILVHDDASTDGTATVIQEFEKKYPDLIRPIYQTENQYSKKVSIKREFIMPLVRGRYVALCEGDDFWTDENKLQRQVDAMEGNSECCMCVHKVAEVFENGALNGTWFPNFQLDTGIISSRDFLAMGQYYSFHTSSFFFRTEHYREYIMDPPEFVRKSSVGDEAHMMYFGQKGPVYYIDKPMSHYRRGVVGSWTARQRNNSDRATIHPKKMIDTYLAFDSYTKGQYHDLLVKRIARQMAVAAILEKKAMDMLKKENREYFFALSLNRRCFVLAGGVFPGLVKMAYLNRIEKKAKAHGIK